MSKELLKSRRELFFAYDIKMGNPNGDPDENRPRVLPDGTHYVTDVRLKRFIRDQFKAQKQEILVDTIDSKTTNLTGRVAHHLEAKGSSKATGSELVEILLDSFIDARLFGSSFAFKTETGKKGEKWEPKPVPKTLTGALQFNHGEVMHEAEPVDIHGTTTFGSAEEKQQGTFTAYFGLRYALIGFNGVANEHSAKLSKMTEKDYASVLETMWRGVRGAANTRSKFGQIPRVLVSVEYKPGSEFQFGNLSDYVCLKSAGEKQEKEWSSPFDYQVDISKLNERFEMFSDKIESISYAVSPDIVFTETLPQKWNRIAID